jgi:hypothetical protein
VSQKPPNWDVTKRIEWLEANPISNKADIAFLRTTIGSFREITTAAHAERQWLQSRLQAMAGGKTSGQN